MSYFRVFLVVLPVFLVTGCNVVKVDTIEDKVSVEVKVDKKFLMASYDETLKMLNLRDKWLKDIPDICWILTGEILDEIWSVDLSSNQIELIDKSLKCLRNLSDLNLSYNQIAKIDNLNENTFLKTLLLHKNQLTSMEWVEKLINLKHLSLWYNKIQQIVWLDNLKDLEILELLRNQIEKIEWLDSLANLQTLKLEFNQIKTAKDVIKKLSSLKIVTLWKNLLDSAELDFISNMLKERK